MRHRTTISRATATAITLAAAALFALTACEATTTDAKPDRSAAPKSSEPAPPDGKSETAALPDFTGKGLQSAQDEAQTVGFYILDSHDALGRGRMQALDRNWKVCSQTPAPGSHSTDTKIDFGTVKLEEDCPAQDADEPAEAAGTMPELRGKSVKVARQTLDSATSITVRDASDQDRMVIVESNWQVCRITPAAGAKLDGKPVVIDAVKFDEDC